MYMRERFHDRLYIPDVISFDVTQAAQWFLRDWKALQEFDWRKLPPMTPPFDDIWMEFYEPSETFSNRGGLLKNVFIKGQRGCLINTDEMPDDMQDYYDGRIGDLLQDSMERGLGRKLVMPEALGDFDDNANARWLMYFLVYQVTKEHCATVLNSVIALDHGGRCVGSIHVTKRENLYSLVLGKSEPAKKEEMADCEEILDKGGAALSQPFMFCLSLMNCRNVEIIDKPAPPAPILKQRTKKGYPYFQYKTLEVTPLRTVRQGGTRKDGTPEPKALHFVRGHFKDFSDKGLFGKYKGVYWWDSQVRGDTAKGIIDKDYRVSRD